MVDQKITDEWEAWKAMCKVLHTVGVEINNENELTMAIKRWGDELVTLRQQQAAEGGPPNSDTPRAYYKAQEGNSY